MYSLATCTPAKHLCVKPASTHVSFFLWGAALLLRARTSLVRSTRSLGPGVVIFPAVALLSLDSILEGPFVLLGVLLLFPHVEVCQCEGRVAWPWDGSLSCPYITGASSLTRGPLCCPAVKF